MGFTLETNVLIKRGPKPEWQHIIEVRATDYIFDGQQWVPVGELWFYPPAAVREVTGVVATEDTLVWNPKGWFKWVDFHEDVTLRLDSVHWAKHLLDEWPNPLYLKPDNDSPAETYTVPGRKFIVRSNIGPMLVHS